MVGTSGIVELFPLKHGSSFRGTVELGGPEGKRLFLTFHPTATEPREAGKLTPPSGGEKTLVHQSSSFRGRGQHVRTFCPQLDCWSLRTTMELLSLGKAPVLLRGLFWAHERLIILSQKTKKPEQIPGERRERRRERRRNDFI